MLRDRRTDMQKFSLRTYLEAVVRELKKAERRTAWPTARTREAVSAYVAAVEVWGQ